MYAKMILEEILRRVAARDESLREARHRRDQVLRAAESFTGALRTYVAGLLATHFTNHPVSDADAGLVMDRRTFPDLGPDGDGELPAELVDDVREHIRPQLATLYPGVRADTMKRGLLIQFNQLLESGEDPTVDLVVGLNRAEDDALWIPNLDQNRWDPSHPEKHVELFTAGAEGQHRTRRHVVRLAKTQIQQFDDPHLCSFNIAALAWECIESAERIDLALWRFFDYAVTELADRLTNDPAGVSAPIRVDDRALAVDRLHRTADGLRLAIDAGVDEEKARTALSAEGVFWKYVPSPYGNPINSEGGAVYKRTGFSVTSAGLLVTGTNTPGAVPLKSTRAFGGQRAYKRQ